MFYKLILGYISYTFQNKKISIFIFRTIKASSGRYRLLCDPILFRVLHTFVQGCISDIHKIAHNTQVLFGTLKNGLTVRSIYSFFFHGTRAPDFYQ